MSGVPGDDDDLIYEQHIEKFRRIEQRKATESNDYQRGFADALAQAIKVIEAMRPEPQKSRRPWSIYARL